MTKLLSELFSLSITVSELLGEMCTAGLFSQGSRPLCTEILRGHGHPPSTILGIRKLETLAYPMVKTASFCVPHVDTIPECHGRTDGRMDGFAVARCKNCWIIRIGYIGILYSKKLTVKFSKSVVGRLAPCFPTRPQLFLMLIRYFFSFFMFCFAKRPSVRFLGSVSNRVIIGRMHHDTICRSFEVLLLRLGKRAQYCYQCVCLCVCLYVREHISGTAGPTFVKFLVQISCGRGDMEGWTFNLLPLAALRYLGEVWCLWMPCFDLAVDHIIHILKSFVWRSPNSKNMSQPLVHCAQVWLRRMRASYTEKLNNN